MVAPSPISIFRTAVLAKDLVFKSIKSLGHSTERCKRTAFGHFKHKLLR